MKIRSILTLLISFASLSFAYGDENYAVKNIPKELLTGANAVLRSSVTNIRIVSADEIYETRHYAITVLNKEGEDFGTLCVFYDKLIKIESVRGWLYDANGAQIDKARKGIIKDRGITTETFYDDLRMKVFDFEYTVYPYTCEYEVELRYTSSIHLSPWAPQMRHDCAVENAQITVTYPKNIKIRHRAFHMHGAHVVDSVGEDENIMSLGLENLRSFRKPDNLTPIEKLSTPTLWVTTDKIILGDMEGTVDTWKNFGSFFYKLNADRDQLPDETKKYIHQLTDTCTTALNKINLLYDHLKKNTRYVNIALGIGGWQTTEARVVAEKGFGDCKGLSNYMKAILKEAGITSYLTLIYGGNDKRRPVLDDFPYNTFNHMILCVPQPKDTIWLECTSDNLPAGYLSSFTSHRRALLLTPSGGYLAMTPVYTDDKNTMTRTATLSINEKDEIAGTVSAVYTGYWWERESPMIRQSKADVDNYFNSKFAIPTYTTSVYKLSNWNVNGVPALSEQVPVTGNARITRKGNRVFVSPHVLTLSLDLPNNYEKRTDSFQIHNDYVVNDTTVITLTGTFTPEQLSKEINLDFQFASYHARTYFEHDNMLKVVVCFRQKDGVYPAAAFADYVKLCKEINTNAAYNSVILARKM